MPNMELITSVTVGSGGAASVTLPATGTIPQTYTDLKVVVSARTNRASGNDALYISINGNTSNLTNKLIEGVGSGTPDSYSTSGATTKVAAIDGNNATASTFGSAEIYFPNYTSSNYKSFSADSVTEDNATSAISVLSANLWSSTSAITTLTFSAIGTLFLEGSNFYLYGISNVTSTTKATGGIVSSDGTYNYHMFPFSGTFTPTQNITADYLVIAGGGGGGRENYSTGIGGGGGAGGLRSTVGATGGGGSLESALSLTANTGYTVTIGAGGAARTTGGVGNNGSNSVFATITSTGGGGGAGGTSGNTFAGQIGGSGGGGEGSSSFSSGGAGTANQGFAGGNSIGGSGGGTGGGGGAGEAGNTDGGAQGGDGVAISAFANATQTGINTYYAGGGGGALYGTVSAGGTGGGGAGADYGVTAGIDGTVNTGGGGGGGTNGAPVASGAGGSGLVIIRYAI
jgi:hypothetical protein